MEMPPGKLASDAVDLVRKQSVTCEVVIDTNRVMTNISSIDNVNAGYNIRIAPEIGGTTPAVAMAATIQDRIEPTNHCPFV